MSGTRWWRVSFVWIIPLTGESDWEEARGRVWVQRVVSAAGQPSLNACIINHDSFVSVYTLNKNRMEIEEKCSKVLPLYEKNILSTSVCLLWGFLFVLALFFYSFSKSTMHISLCTLVFQARWTSDQCSLREVAWLCSIWVDPRDGCWKPPYPLQPPSNFLTWTKTSTYRLMLESNCTVCFSDTTY